MKQIYRNQRLQKAITLVEVLVAILIFTFILGVFYSAYYSGIDLFESTTSEEDLQAQARQTMNFMVSELRNATRTSTQNPSPNLSITSGPNLKQIDFVLPVDDGYIIDSNGNIEWDTNNHIRYKYIPGQSFLRREEKGTLKILVQDVSDIQFMDIDTDATLGMSELKIILTLTKTTPKRRTISFTLTAIVRLRN